MSTESVVYEIAEEAQLVSDHGNLPGRAIYRLGGIKGEPYNDPVPRSDLLRAAALIVAEIERLDRAAEEKP